MANPTLEELIAATQAPKAAAATGSKRPKGQVKVLFNGQPLFSQAIWGDSTTENAITNELNDLCLNDKDTAIKVFTKMLKQATVEITLPSTSSAAPLTDLINGLN